MHAGCAAGQRPAALGQGKRLTSAVAAREGKASAAGSPARELLHESATRHGGILRVSFVPVRAGVELARSCLADREAQSMMRLIRKAVSLGLEKHLLQVML